jgi:hypothetical protein
MLRVAILSLLSACSFFIDKAPAKDPGTRPVPCTASMAPPIADAAGAGALVVIGVASLAASDDTSSTSFVVAEVLVFAVAAVAGYSAYTGYTSVKRCRAYNAQN